MSIIGTLKKKRLQMRKENPKAYATLSNVIGDFELKSKLAVNIGKPEDELAVKVVKVEISHLNEQIATLSDQDEIASIRGAIEILEAVLPANLTSDEIRAIILQSKEDGVKFGDFMKFMKSNFFGRYDGKETSSLAKQLLS